MCSIPCQFSSEPTDNNNCSTAIDNIFSAILAAEAATPSDVKCGIVTNRTPQLLRPSALHFAKNGRSYEERFHPYSSHLTLQKSFATTPPSVIIKQEPDTESPPEWQYQSPRSDEDSYDRASSSNTKICTVCGDLARGHHYDVISCNGCKTFFRRTVIAGRKFRCLKDGKCDLNRRCACRACRFNKCVEVGMNPKTIQYQSGAASTSSAVIQKRSLSSDEDSPSPQRLDAIVSPDDDYRTSQTIDFLLLVEQMADRLRRSSFMPESDELVTVDLLNMPTIFADEIKSWPVRPPNLTAIQSIPLTERRKVGLKIWYYIESLLAIEYAKMLPGIEQLSFDDKLALCRSTCYSTIILTQGFCAYQQKSDMICFPDGFRPLRNVKNPTTIQMEINCKIPEILRRIEIDKAQHALVKAIVFLNTTAPGLSDEGRALVDRLRTERANDLLQYLRSSMGPARGAAQFATLISLCDTCTRLCAKQQANFVKAVFVDRRINPPPLMIELIAQIGHTKPVGTPNADRSPASIQWG